MRPDDVYLIGWAQDPHLSRDGRQVAWSEISLDRDKDGPVSHVMVASTDGSAPPRSFSDGPHDHFARWSPDGRYLAYVSVRDGTPALTLAPLAGGSPHTVKADGPVRWLEWSPSGEEIVLVVNVAEDKPAGDDARSANAPRLVRGMLNRLDGAGWFDGRDHLFVYDMATTNLRRLTSGDFDHRQPSWSPDGSLVVFVSDRSKQRDDHPREDVWTLRVRGRGAPHRVTSDIAEASFPAFSPDGSRIAVVGLEGKEQIAGRDVKLFVVDASGSDEPRQVAPGVDRPVGFTLGAVPFAWLSNDELVFTVADGGAVELRRARLHDRQGRPVVTGDCQVSGVSLADGGRTLAYGSAWVDAPAEIYVLEIGRTRRPARRASAAGDRLRAAVSMLPATRFRTAAPDGLDLEYFVMSPRGTQKSGATSSRKPPLFVEIHGGPHLHNPICEMFFHYQCLAAAGYAVVMANPRGSTGYGGRFTGLARGDWGEGPFADVTACADDALKRGLADRRRQFVGGYSYGGYLSSWAIGHTRRYKAACIGAPVTDHISLFGTWDGGGYLADALAGDPWGDHEKVRAQSPVAYAPAFATPVLLYVNDGDLRCPPSQSDELYAALRWHGNEVEYLRYPGGSHLSAFSMVGAPSQNEDREQRILDWLARHGGLRG